jgi:hypothetical protein
MTNREEELPKSSLVKWAGAGGVLFGTLFVLASPSIGAAIAGVGLGMAVAATILEEQPEGPSSPVKIVGCREHGYLRDGCSACYAALLRAVGIRS